MKKVQILLSTYNGQKYLEDQIESLLNQQYDNFSILIRDDGSQDSTVEILKRWKKQYGNIDFYVGKNLGVWKSFFDLMHHADRSADYFAFCDQDDYWQPEKLKKGVNHLKRMDSGVPLLYCSNTTPVDEAMNVLKRTIRNLDFRPSFGNAVIQNICTGCTAIINKRLLEMAQMETPEFTVMHDWWLYLISSCFGQVYYDNDSYIYYRQHQGNEVGARINRIEQTKYRLKTYRQRRGRIYWQLEEFQRIFQLEGENKELLQLVLDTKNKFRKRIEMIWNRKIYRQDIIDDLVYKAVILIGDA